MSNILIKLTNYIIYSNNICYVNKEILKTMFGKPISKRYNIRFNDYSRVCIDELEHPVDYKIMEQWWKQTHWTNHTNKKV